MTSSLPSDFEPIPLQPGEHVRLNELLRGHRDDGTGHCTTCPDNPGPVPFPCGPVWYARHRYQMAGKPFPVLAPTETGDTPC